MPPTSYQLEMTVSRPNARPTRSAVGRPSRAFGTTSIIVVRHDLDHRRSELVAVSARRRRGYSIHGTRVRDRRPSRRRRSPRWRCSPRRCALGLAWPRFPRARDPILRDVHEPVCVHLASRHLPANVLRPQEGERVLGFFEILPEEMTVATYLENSAARVVTRPDAMNHVVRHEAIMCRPPPTSTPRCERGDRPTCGSCPAVRCTEWSLRPVSTTARLKSSRASSPIANSRPATKAANEPQAASSLSATAPSLRVERTGGRACSPRHGPAQAGQGLNALLAGSPGQHELCLPRWISARGECWATKLASLTSASWCRACDLRSVERSLSSEVQRVLLHWLDTRVAGRNVLRRPSRSPSMASCLCSSCLPGWFIHTALKKVERFILLL